MFENLIHTLPEHRHAALQAQLALLESRDKAVYTGPEELALALATDSAWPADTELDTQSGDVMTAT